MRRFPMMETNRCVAGLGEAEDGVRSGMARVRQSMLGFFPAPRGALFLTHRVTLLCKTQ